MSFDGVCGFVRLYFEDPVLQAEVEALDTDPADATAVSSFAAKRGFEFSEEEYRFLRPYALVLAREASPDRGILGEDHARPLPPPTETAPRATVLGNSHASVIRLAADAVGVPLTVHSFMLCPQPYVDSESPGDMSAFHPVVAKSISTGVVFSAIGRSMHERLFLMQHPRKFDFVSPELPELPFQPDAEVVPFGAMYRTCASALELDLKLIALARATATGPFYHIMVQPPLEDDALALAMTPFDRAHVPLFAVSKSSLRMKIYRLCCAITEAWCDAHGVPILPPPAEAVNERGFLKPDLALNTTHGNQAYGELVLDQMMALL